MYLYNICSLYQASTCCWAAAAYSCWRYGWLAGAATGCLKQTNSHLFPFTFQLFSGKPSKSGFLISGPLFWGPCQVYIRKRQHERSKQILELMAFHKMCLFCLFQIRSSVAVWDSSLQFPSSLAQTLILYSNISKGSSVKNTFLGFP